jgi:septal ring factor EnvC (AmiA/AmiB activator)
MSNPVATSKSEPTGDEPDTNDLYCEKCYETLNYFIDECQTMAPKLTKLKANLCEFKRDNTDYRSTLEDLQFNLEEVKAQKEDIEERYNILIKTLSKTSISPKPANEETLLPEDSNSETIVEQDPQFVIELKRKLTEKLEQLDKSVDKSEIESEADGQVECYRTTNVEIYNTITLDLNYLTRQFFSETKINSQKILEYFGKKILEAKGPDHKRQLEIQYLPSSKKKCTDSDIELRKEINDLQVQLRELRVENEKLKAEKSAPSNKQGKKLGDCSTG